LRLEDKNMDLYKIRDEINEIIKQKQQELNLTFDEESHTYTMMDKEGNLKSDWPSVSKVMKLFYTEFDSDGIAEKKAKGDPMEKMRLLNEWSAAGTYSTNMGSRVHYFLEKKSCEMFGLDKEVREPIFEVDFEQTIKGDSMINAGEEYLYLMKEREGVLLDTEIVLGSNELGYVGQPDKKWLFFNKDKTEVGIVVTDWKTNRKKNFEANHFTKKMKYPFNDLDDTALGHYFTQLPFYGKLFLDMLKGSKYENIKLFGCVVVHLSDDGKYEEYRIPKRVINTILEMDMSHYLTK
jgi:hypothetical protein